MVILQIPEENKAGIKLLITSSNETFGELLSSVREISPTASFATLTSEIGSRVKELQTNELQEIISALTSINSLLESSDLGIEEIVEGIIHGVLSDEYFSELPREQIDRFKEQLTTFLETDNALNAASKASDLLLEYERIFSNARIVTDIRPVFKSDIDKGIVGALIVHTLKIEYQDRTGTKELYLALDALDLMTLAEQVFRAEDKAELLQSMLKNAKIPCIERYPNLRQEDV